MIHRAPRAVAPLLPVLLATLVASGLPVRGQGTEYSQPALDPNHATESFLPVESIDTFSGAVSLVYTDVSLPGPNGFSLNIIRWYNSKINRWDSNHLNRERELTSVGVGWQMHMGRLWDNPAPTNPTPAFRVELPGGRQENFYNNNVFGPQGSVPNAAYVSPEGWSLRINVPCADPGAGNCEIATSPAGIEYHFPTGSAYRMDPDDSYLYVRTIRDPVGNAITVTYDHSCNCNQAYIDTSRTSSAARFTSTIKTMPSTSGRPNASTESRRQPRLERRPTSTMSTRAKPTAQCYVPFRRPQA